ncbi:MATE family efflux transporter [Arsenicicoccus sp. oral taxon 190]|uniref:MATE family efflux transporter n=1 Tax=Arsenicicoccus sp. oral taxon 190 TaxID=1658671 RepID=UPI000679FB84|nr:MATE family efflux transporter [Arsenicicoccus sp. oral taxon 190]AKT50923.1 multidrug transporter MatE [Arsenicicoccus sp. oral taxon 190]
MSPSIPPSPAREITRLAVPAFLALVAEPLFLLADSAIVGHLGTPQLAGLGVASAALLTAANIFVFLAYGTTSVVARHVGAGDERGAVANGLDGVWLAAALGLVTSLVVAAAARPLVSLFGASADAVTHAEQYLRISAAGIPAMLVVLAATGILRGVQDTRTPLVVSVAGFTANVALNLLLVYGLHLGIGGSALGTVISQWGMAIALLAVVVRAARRLQADLRPHPGRVLVAARGGVPLLVRTLALRAVLLLTTWAAAGLGDVPLGAYQVSATVWSFLTFALDALAIAAQALTGKALGAGDAAGTRAMTSLMVRWGLVGGAILGLLLLAVHRVLPPLFTPDPATQAALAAGLVVVALGQPISGWVFVLDGVLIGAGDARWLARAQLVLLLAYLPVVLAVRHVAAPVGDAAALIWLWAGFTVFMTLRGIALALRARTDAWLVTGATR